MLITIVTLWFHFPSGQKGPRILILGGQCLHFHVRIFSVACSSLCGDQSYFSLTMCHFAVKCLWLSNRQLCDSKHFSGLIYSGEEGLRNWATITTSLLREGTSSALSCVLVLWWREAALNAAERRGQWRFEQLQVELTLTQLGLCFFQLKSWASVAYTCQGAGSFLPCSAHCQCWCGDSGITWAVGDEGFVWQKQGCEWVRACQAVVQDCSCLGMEPATNW